MTSRYSANIPSTNSEKHWTQIATLNSSLQAQESTKGLALFVYITSLK